jgi:hypothetical protein
MLTEWSDSRTDRAAVARTRPLRSKNASEVQRGFDLISVIVIVIIGRPQVIT